MADKLNGKKVGLALGLFIALLHAVWAIGVAILPSNLQKFIDWAFMVHFLEPIAKLTSFNLVNSFILVVMTFVCGYVMGWVFAGIYNWVGKRR